MNFGFWFLIDFFLKVTDYVYSHVLEFSFVVCCWCPLLLFFLSFLSLDVVDFFFLVIRVGRVKKNVLKRESVCVRVCVCAWCQCGFLFRLMFFGLRDNDEKCLNEGLAARWIKIILTLIKSRHVQVSNCVLRRRSLVQLVDVSCSPVSSVVERSTRTCVLAPVTWKGLVFNPPMGHCFCPYLQEVFWINQVILSRVTREKWECTYFTR